jgi:hypothetical protein
MSPLAAENLSPSPSPAPRPLTIPKPDTTLAAIIGPELLTPAWNPAPPSMTTAPSRIDMRRPRRSPTIAQAIAPTQHPIS